MHSAKMKQDEREESERQAAADPLYKPLDPDSALSEARTFRSFEAARKLFLLAILLWCAVPLSPQSVDSDFWGHVQYGRDTWQHGLAHTSTYSYTSEGHRWINHENLAELIFAAGIDLLGAPSLLVLKCLLGLSLLSVGIGRARAQGCRTGVIAIVCVLAAINLSFYWGLRPHVFSFVFFGWMIAWTDYCFSGWCLSIRQVHQLWEPVNRDGSNLNGARPVTRLNQLWWVPLALVLWANTHGGFLAGAAVFTTILGLRACEIVLSRQPDRWAIATKLLLIAGISCVATLVNPYGIQLHGWLFQSLGSPRPEIMEWHPPDWLAASSLKLWAVLIVAALGWSLSNRRRDVTQLIVFSLVLFQACRHQRHLPFVVILILFWLPVHLHSAWCRFRARTGIGDLLRRDVWTGNDCRWPRLACIALLALNCWFAFQLGPRLSHVPVSGRTYPVAALQYIVDRELSGRMVVSGQWAQYVIGTIGARTAGDSGVRVAFDGRFRTCYPQEVVDMHFDFFLGEGGPDKRYRSPHSPAIAGERLLEFRQPNLVLMNRHQAHAQQVIEQVQHDWVLLYQDSLAQLWGRRSVHGDPQRDTFIPPDLRQLNGRVAGLVRFPAAPRTHATPRIRSETETSHREPTPTETRHRNSVTPDRDPDDAGHPSTA